jgi:hypothetical protein
LPLPTLGRRPSVVPLAIRSLRACASTARESSHHTPAMLSTPRRYEIDHRTLKLIVGLIALTLANITSFLSDRQITSISASYHHGDWARDIFVGFLFAIAAFLAAYNGLSRPEMIMSRIASIAALGVALFPCGCDGKGTRPPVLHDVSAGILFIILAGFCWIFHRRAVAKPGEEAKRRSRIYIVSGIVIVGSILLIVADSLMDGVVRGKLPRLVYYCEKAALIAFGASWLTASKVLPGLASREERHHPLA